MREIELAEAVATRLIKWSKILGAAVAIPLVLVGILFGKSYWDFHHAVISGESQIKKSINDGVKQVSDSANAATMQISEAETKLPVINRDISGLESDIVKYKGVNKHIDKLQADVMGLQRDVVDLGQKTLKARVLEATGPGAGRVAFREAGCSAKDQKDQIALCAQGSPLMFFAQTSDGNRPVGSISNIGFQDVSSSPKPTCDQIHRGMIYVQKGGPHQADMPFACIKDASDAYKWLSLVSKN